MNLGTIPDAVAAMGSGDFVLVVDNEQRENEGDLIVSAEKVTSDQLAFMVRHTSGLICLAMTGQRLDQLDLPMMVLDNTDVHKTAFTVSIDYIHGTTTGISAHDRAKTIRATVDASTQPSDFSRPGHIFPLRYQEGGVLARPGHTEASLDLAKLAGVNPSAALSELVNDDGSMARGETLTAFASEHGIVMVSIDDLVAYRWRTERIVERESSAMLPTRHGVFEIVGYRSGVDGSQHVALIMGDLKDRENVLTRVHSVCLTGDVFGSLRCDCGTQLDESLRLISEEGTGVVVYNTSHEGRGIGILNKIAAYNLQDQGLDTVDANRGIGHADDSRHYGIDAQILNDLGIATIRLLTNNPDKIEQLCRFGVDVVGREPLWVGETAENESYLQTKMSRMGHFDKNEH